MQRARAAQLFTLKVKLCAQISRYRSKLRCVSGSYAVVPSRTNLLLVVVLCRYKAAFKIELVNSHKYCSNFFLKQDILISHLTQNDSLAFLR